VYVQDVVLGEQGGIESSAVVACGVFYARVSCGIKVIFLTDGWAVVKLVPLILVLWMYGHFMMTQELAAYQHIICFVSAIF